MAPIPKPAGMRQRRNRAATSAKLQADPKLKAPNLPELPDRLWHPMTLAWWADVWRSPMAPEYDESDRHGLFLLAVLVDDFWVKPSKDLAAEIRLQRQSFGLSPIDRRRLQWEIDRGDEATERTRKRRAAPAARKGSDGKPVDPRSVLHAV
ncbi:phage terminase small subunit [Sphaerimonospora thailandensis]|uniref:Bacteriophage protein n=1 Tax=Sphaerimonospora thailandensis TaxID=795644 RepID=A0A8J3R6Q6_9ACTN|nr:hypothetical protein [Sphaerimonospora thailandensis]GIH70331.1 bacteriophage protein [Sphaerimonospora thailandensis]